MTRFLCTPPTSQPMAVVSGLMGVPVNVRVNSSYDRPICLCWELCGSQLVRLDFKEQYFSFCFSGSLCGLQLMWNTCGNRLLKHSARMCPENTRKLMGFYMEVLILGVVLQYILFPIGLIEGKMLIARDQCVTRIPARLDASGLPRPTCARM